MRSLIILAESGVRALLAYRLRSVVIVLCLVCVQTPYLVGLSLSQGLLNEAQVSINAGPDLTVSARQAGREAMLPLSVVERLDAVAGVDKVVPRLVGSTTIGKDGFEAVVVGLAPASMPQALECVDGRWFREGNEIVIGRDLASALQIRVGDVLPPFYNSRRGDHLAEVVGIFRSDVSLWQSRVMLTSLDFAAQIFDAGDVCSDVLVYARPGYTDLLSSKLRSRELIESLAPGLRLQTLTKEEARRLLPAGAGVRQSAFSWFLLPALALAGAVVLLSSGLGDSERRREIGVLKALGWQTDQVLFRGAVESVALSVLAASISLIGTWLWLRAGNAAGIAALFFPHTGLAPNFQVPSELMPSASIVAFVTSTTLVLVPCLWSHWRTALAEPREAMR